MYYICTVRVLYLWYTLTFILRYLWFKSLLWNPVRFAHINLASSQSLKKKNDQNPPAIDWRQFWVKSQDKQFSTSAFTEDEGKKASLLMLTVKIIDLYICLANYTLLGFAPDSSCPWLGLSGYWNWMSEHILYVWHKNLPRNPAWLARIS